MTRVLAHDREAHFRSAYEDASDAALVSPFFSEPAARLLIRDGQRRKLRIITRFNLEDFFAGVSQITALEMLVRAGAEIRGIKGLHSKLYIFDERKVLVSSANMTRGGLVNNHEFGVEIEEKAVSVAAVEYFEELWSAGKQNVTLSQLADWKEKVDESRAKRGTPSTGKLPDQGADATGASPFDPTLEPHATPSISDFLSSEFEGTRYYVKFYGTSENRREWHESVRSVIERSECHYACTYPANRRPIRIRHGDVMYMAHLTKKPNGYAIYGRARAIPYVPGRDDASPNEISRLPWKSDWSRYIRVFDPVFIDGSLSDCVTLHSLMERFGSETFLSTARNAAAGSGNTRPTGALRQAPDVALCPDPAAQLECEFQTLLERFGAVPRAFIEQLPKPDIQYDHSIRSTSLGKVK